MRKVCSVCLVLLMISLISGCATKYPDADTVYIQKNGTIEEASVESFDKSYYSQEELEAFIEDEIAEYETDHASGDVEMKSFEVENDVAKLMMKFDDYQAYTDFNGRELFAGNIVQAIAAGYTFDVDFVEVKDGEMVGATASTEDNTEQMTVTETVTGSEVTANDDYKVVILNEDTNVQIRGSIKYVSAAGVRVTDKNHATVEKQNDALSYIVYK